MGRDHRGQPPGLAERARNSCNSPVQSPCDPGVPSASTGIVVCRPSSGEATVPQRDPAGIVDVRIVVAAVVADPPLVHQQVLARLDPIDAVLVLLDPDRAAGGAAGADAAVPPHEPDPLLIEEVLVAQRPTGQRSTTLPESLLFRGKPAMTSISSWAPRPVNINSLVPLISAANRTQRLHRTQRSTNSVTSPKSRAGW